MSTLTAPERYHFRRLRTRRKIYGTPERPRLSVARTSKHIYAQLVDDTQGHTLAFASSVEPDLRPGGKTGANVAAAKAVGEALAARAKAAGVENVVFDRGGRPYHGRVKAVADGARAGGLKF
jgi:large subunit ribosomal protein L18